MPTGDRREETHGLLNENRNMAGQSASDTAAFCAAARRHSSGLDSHACRAVAWDEPLPDIAQPVLGLFPVGDETVRLPKLKLVALANEGDPVGNAGVGLQRLGQNHAAVLIDLQDLALADQRGREVLVVLRERLEVLQDRTDRGPELVAAGVDRLSVERRAAIEAVEPIHRQDRAERRRNRNPPLGIEPVGEGGNELVHCPRPSAHAAP